MNKYLSRLGASLAVTLSLTGFSGFDTYISTDCTTLTGTYAVVKTLTRKAYSIGVTNTCDQAIYINAVEDGDTLAANDGWYLRAGEAIAFTSQYTGGSATSNFFQGAIYLKHAGVVPLSGDVFTSVAIP